MTAPTDYKIRLTAFFVFIATLLFIKTQLIVIPIFLTIDFFLRAFKFGKWSLLGKLSAFISQLFKLEGKPVFFPPKQFAAKIGFWFSLGIVLCSYFNINTVFLSSILLVCSGLEAFFNFCAGCYVYNLYLGLKHRI